MNIYLAVNDQKDDHLAFTGHLAEYIEDRGSRAVILRARKDRLGNYHFSIPEDISGVMVALGGDGTFLQCANDLNMAGRIVPLVGVNLGTLGFLTQVERDEAEMAVADILDGRYAVEEFPILSATVARSGRELYTEQACNDIVVGREGFARVIQMDVYVDHMFAYQAWCDGIVVSTPMGSTAYNISLGGPVITPGSGVFAITPIAPHMPGLRPILVPQDADIEIRVAGRAHGGESVPATRREALLTCDGRSNDVWLESGDTVKIRKHSRSGRILKVDSINRSFYDIFRQKLLTIV